MKDKCKHEKKVVKRCYCFYQIKRCEKCGQEFKEDYTHQEVEDFR